MRPTAENRVYPIFRSEAVLGTATGRTRCFQVFSFEPIQAFQPADGLGIDLDASGTEPFMAVMVEAASAMDMDNRFVLVDGWDVPLGPWGLLDAALENRGPFWLVAHTREAGQ